MGQAREALLDLVNQFNEVHEQAQGYAYESPPYEAYFSMVERLSTFIVEGFESGALEAKDLFDTQLDLKRLFATNKNEQVVHRCDAIFPRIEKALKAYCQS